MKKVVKLEYDKNQFIEAEIQQDDSDGGLGGLEKVLTIGQKTFDRSISGLVSFLNATSDKIQRNINAPNWGEVSITIGASFSAEGNLILASSTSEVSLSITITFKDED